MVAGENEYVPAREDNHKIEWGDTIRNPKLLDKNGDLMLFDIVTANPPFSLDKWGHDEAENDKFTVFVAVYRRRLKEITLLSRI